MTDILAEIVRRKRADVARWKQSRPLDVLDAEAENRPPRRGFTAALRQASEGDGWGLIAEVKKASPSHGLIRPDFDPPVIARAYQSAGACCLSVLTDRPYFSGDNADLAAAREATRLPVLRKDFMVDPWQVAEADAIGADCILVIMAALGDGQAAEIESAAMERGLDVLIETHHMAELERALRLRSPLLGINNRNLKTLETSLDVSIGLAGAVPRDRIVISESGIRTHVDLIRLGDAGIRCFLVGESLLRQADIARATRDLLGTSA